MKCDKCGNDINENLLLCPKCGNLLKKPEREPNTNNNPVNGLSATTKSPFNETNTTRDTKALESIIQSPNGVRNTTMKLLTSVEFYVLIGFYIAILVGLNTLSFYITKESNASLHTLLLNCYSLMIMNIGPAIFYILFFNKANIPIFLATIPGINLITYYRNGLYDYDKLKDIFTLLIVIAILMKIFPSAFMQIGSLMPRLSSIVSGIYGLVTMIILIIVYIRANNNYCLFFGFKSTIFRILSSIVPIPMQLIVIFDNNRVFKK